MFILHTYHTSWFGRDYPGEQNVPEYHFSEIFKMNSSLMTHCYEIIPLNGHL